MFLFLHRLLILLTCDMAAKKNNLGERIWSSRCFLNPDFTVCKNLFPSKRETFFGHSLWSSVLCIILIPFKKGTTFCLISQISKAHSQNPWEIPGKFLGNAQPSQTTYQCNCLHNGYVTQICTSQNSPP